MCCLNNFHSNILNWDQKSVSSFPDPRSTSCLGRTLASPLHKWISKQRISQNLNGWQNKTCPISRLSLSCYTRRLCSAKTDLCGLPGKPHLSNGPSTRGSSRWKTDKPSLGKCKANSHWWLLKQIFLRPVFHFSSDFPCVLLVICL